MRIKDDFTSHTGILTNPIVYQIKIQKHKN
jgi:hypothetical protein